MKTVSPPFSAPRSLTKRLNLNSELNGIMTSVSFPASFLNLWVGALSLVALRLMIASANWTRPVSEASPLHLLWIASKLDSAFFNLAFISFISLSARVVCSREATAIFLILA